MHISRSYKDQLLAELKKKPFINIQFQNEAYAIDPQTGIEKLMSEKKFGDFYFNKKETKLYKSFIQFQEEVYSNRLYSGINLNLYANEIISEFNSILELFKIRSFHGQNYEWRTDAEIYYMATHQEDKPISDLSYFPKETISQVAEIFVFQKEIIIDSISLLKSLIPQDNKRHYNTTYQYNYFKFEELSHFDSDEEIRLAKIDFFNELAEKGFIDVSELKTVMNYFNDIGSKIKVKWNGTREELYYLIKSLIDYNIIKQPKRETSRIISKVFCDTNGNNYNPTLFHSLHTPKKVKTLDQIISILKS